MKNFKIVKWSGLFVAMVSMIIMYVLVILNKVIPNVILQLLFGGCFVSLIGSYMDNIKKKTPIRKTIIYSLILIFVAIASSYIARFFYM